MHRGATEQQRTGAVVCACKNLRGGVLRAFFVSFKNRPHAKTHQRTFSANYLFFLPLGKRTSNKVQPPADFAYRTGVSVFFFSSHNQRSSGHTTDQATPTHHKRRESLTYKNRSQKVNRSFFLSYLCWYITFITRAPTSASHPLVRFLVSYVQSFTLSFPRESKMRRTNSCRALDSPK